MADVTQEKASHGNVDRGFGDVDPPKEEIDVASSVAITTVPCCFPQRGQPVTTERM
jgi:hypothetical protein